MDHPEDIALAYTGEQLTGDVLTQAITDGCPDVLLPGGYCAQRSAAAVIQSKDGNAMSATFVIASRKRESRTGKSAHPPGTILPAVHLTITRFNYSLLYYEIAK